MQVSGVDNAQLAWTVVALMMTALAIATTTISFVMGCLLYRKLPQTKSHLIINRDSMEIIIMCKYFIYEKVVLQFLFVFFFC